MLSGTARSEKCKNTRFLFLVPFLLDEFAAENRSVYIPMGVYMLAVTVKL